MSAIPPDRYLTFTGLECDTQATQIVDRLKQLILAPDTSSLYRTYLTQKLDEQQNRNQDDLHFVHSQINVLMDCFKACNDQEGLQMLERIEVECC